MLSKNLIVPNPPLLRPTDFRAAQLDIVPLLRKSSWTPELEHVFEKFSFGAFLDYAEYATSCRTSYAKAFYDYLKANVRPLRRRP